MIRPTKRTKTYQPCANLALRRSPRCALREGYGSSSARCRTIALREIVQEFGCRVDAGNQQMIPGARAGDVEQMALGVIDFRVPLRKGTQCDMSAGYSS
jgi:hypothetical protein